MAAVENCPDPPTDRTIQQTFLAGIRVEEATQDDLEATLHDSTVAALTSLQAVTWDRVRLHTASDPHMNQLVTIVESGMPPNRHELPPALRAYHQFRDGLYTVDGVVVYKNRVVIPLQLANRGKSLKWCPRTDLMPETHICYLLYKR